MAARRPTHADPEYPQVPRIVFGGGPRLCARSTLRIRHIVRDPKELGSGRITYVANQSELESLDQPSATLVRCVGLRRKVRQRMILTRELPAPDKDSLKKFTGIGSRRSDENMYVGIRSVSHPSDPHDLPPRQVEVAPDVLAVHEDSQGLRGSQILGGARFTREQDRHCERGRPCESIHPTHRTPPSHGSVVP